MSDGGECIIASNAAAGFYWSMGKTIRYCESGQSTGSCFSAGESDDRSELIAVDDGRGDDVGICGIGRAQSDVLAVEADVLDVSVGRNDDLVAVDGGVDAGLDGWLIAGNVDRSGVNDGAQEKVENREG